MIEIRPKKLSDAHQLAHWKRAVGVFVCLRIIFVKNNDLGG